MTALPVSDCWYQIESTKLLDYHRSHNLQSMSSSAPPGDPSQVEHEPRPTLLRRRSSRIQASNLNTSQGTSNTLSNSQPTRIESRRRSASVLSNDNLDGQHTSKVQKQNVVKKQVTRKKSTAPKQTQQATEVRSSS